MYIAAKFIIGFFLRFEDSAPGSFPYDSCTTGTAVRFKTGSVDRFMDKTGSVDRFSESSGSSSGGRYHSSTHSLASDTYSQG